MGRRRKHDLPFERVTIDDLKSDTALEHLRQHAIQVGWWEDGEHRTLQFVALAERALRVGRNPGAVFHTLIKRRLTNNITQADEDHAIQRIKSARSRRMAKQVAAGWS
ncbi:MAG: hypothetical protein OXG53_17990 [Chloroflexi bacterium]|nr:hypothetical protein [Chloroflexota bacterium]